MRRADQRRAAVVALYQHETGRPIEDPEHATARIAYTVQEKPYWIDVPFGPGR